LIIGYELQVRKLGIAACRFQTKIVAVHLNKRLTLPSDCIRSTILSHLRARTISTGMCCWRFSRILYMDNLPISTYRPQLAP
jgi:hypothetical protein